MRTDDVGFMLVDLKKLAYQNDPFIMAEQAKQLFYVQDPCVSPLSTQMTPNAVGEEEADDVHANRNDCDEGELINII